MKDQGARDVAPVPRAGSVRTFFVTGEKGKEKLHKVPIDDLETKQVIIAALAGVFGVALLSIVGHFEGTFSFGESAYQVADYAVPAALVSLGAATVVSGRELGSMETWEQGAVAVALLTIGSSKYVPEVETFLMENAPYATLGAVVVSFVAYYILAWRD